MGGRSWGGTLIGYARVPPQELDTDHQILILAAAGVRPDDLYVDRGITGVRTDQPQLDCAMGTRKEGDTLIIITTPWRLGRSTPDLLTIAERLRASGAGFRVLDSAEPPNKASALDATTVLPVLTAVAGMEFQIARERIQGSGFTRRPGSRMKMAPASPRDAATNTVATTLTGIDSPHNVQATQGGRSIWAVSGTTAMAVEIDSETNEVHGAVSTGAMPAHVIVTPDESRTYTTNNADNTVSAFDIATMTTIATIPVGDGPHGLRPSPDGTTIYVANIKGTTLSVIDTATNTQTDEIEVGKSPAQVAFSPDGKFFYASLNGDNAVAKIDTTTRRLVATIPVGDGPIQTFVSPNGKYLLVANQGTKDQPSRTVSIIDTATFTAVGTVETGAGAHGVVIDPTSQDAYITNTFENTVSVLNLETLSVVATIPVGAMPNGITFTTQAMGIAPTLQLDLKMKSTDGSGMGH